MGRRGFSEAGSWDMSGGDPTRTDFIGRIERMLPPAPAARDRALPVRVMAAHRRDLQAAAVEALEGRISQSDLPPWLTPEANPKGSHPRSGSKDQLTSSGHPNHRADLEGSGRSRGRAVTQNSE